jgi:hypothetical protein
MTSARPAAFTVVALGALLTACLDPAGPAAIEPPATSTTSASPAMEPASGDRGAVEDAYRAFWVVAHTLDDHPVGEWPRRLGAVTTEPLYPSLLRALVRQHESGIREYGRVRPHPMTVEVRGSVATVVDCQDASGAGEADTDTGLPRTAGESRTPIAASLRRGADGRWRVSEARQLDTTC